MAYTALVPFQNGLKWGFKDLTGKTRIKPVYDMASPFKNGISVVIKDGKAGLLAASGDFILEPVYDAIEPRDDLAMYLFRENGKTGMVSYSGEMLSPALFDEVGELSEGLFPALKENCWGFYNGRLQEVIPSIYLSAKKFRYGVAEVTDLIGITFLIDRMNNRVTTPGAVYAGEEHLRSYSPDDLDVLYPSQLHYGKYREFSMPSGGGKLLSTLGYELITGKIYELYNACGDGYLITGSWPRMEFPQNDDCMRYGVINTRGDQILPLVFEHLKYLGSGAFSFKLGAKWGVINSKLEVLVEPHFNYPVEIENGLVVRRERASLFINTWSEQPGKEEFKEGMLRSGLKTVRLDGNTAYYDKVHDIDPTVWVDCMSVPDARSKSKTVIPDRCDPPHPEFSHGLISAAALHETQAETFEIDEEIYERVIFDGPVFSLEDIERPETWMLPDGDKFSFRRAFDYELKWIERLSSSTNDERSILEGAREILDHSFDQCECGPDDPEDPGHSKGSFPFDDDDDDEEGGDDEYTGEYEEDHYDDLGKILRRKKEGDPEAEPDEDPGPKESTTTYRGAGMLLDSEGHPSAVVKENVLEKWGEGVYFAYNWNYTLSSATILNSNFEVIFPGLHPVENDRYTNGKYFRVTLAGKYGLIDRKGRLVLDPVFNSLSRFIKGTAFALTDDAAVVIDGSFNCRYLDIEAVNFSSFDGETVAIAVYGSKGIEWGLITTSGEEVLPFRYELLRRVSSEYILAKRDGSFGVINNSGAEVLPFVYTGYTSPTGKYLPLISNTGLFTLFNIRKGKTVDSFRTGSNRHHLCISGIKRLRWGYHILRLDKEIEYINPAVPPRNTRIMATPPLDLDGLI